LAIDRGLGSQRGKSDEEEGEMLQRTRRRKRIRGGGGVGGPKRKGDGYQEDVDQWGLHTVEVHG